MSEDTATGAELNRRHKSLARGLLEDHGGREVDNTDTSLAALERKHSLAALERKHSLAAFEREHSLLLLFDRPWNAVSYALAYHEGLRELGLAARVGIHLGEVILHRNTLRDVERGAKPVEVEGLAKPTAARLMSLAEEGERRFDDQ